MAEVSRGYEESKSNYNSLLQKQLQSQLATSLQTRQQGEQFRLIDPASLPDKPSAPNHLLVSLGGLAVGLAIGLGLAILLEIINVRVWHESDLEGLVPARVLVGIPRLSTPAEERKRSNTRLVEILAAVTMVGLMVAGNLYVFFKG
jgi:capsular polysaccharide biosynthesis protein